MSSDGIRKMYRSMQGKLVDMELLSQANELAPAIGNMRVNARGDELGPGGKIIRKREDIIAEYYENNPNAVPEERMPLKPSPQRLSGGNEE
jgi:hypothetical protein